VCVCPCCPCTWRSLTCAVFLRAPRSCSIPVRYLKDAVPEIDDSEGVPAHEEVGGPPQCPILVFINPSSGGKCGPLLQKMLRQGLGEQQVCTQITS
jgi:hypothetical protein